MCAGAYSHAMKPKSETDLYPPIRDFLTRQGYEVKGEIGPCDILAMRGEEEPLVVELKLTLSLALILQGVERLRLSDAVYLAAPDPGAKGWGKKRRAMLGLLRRLGLGLILVRFTKAGAVVTPVLEPGAPLPARSKIRRARLMKEFAARRGDPEAGGAPAREKLTAYRQDALRLAQVLAENGPMKAADAARAAGAPRAGDIFRANHYGWFIRISRGVYELTEEGKAGLARFPAPPPPFTGDTAS